MLRFLFNLDSLMLRIWFMSCNSFMLRMWQQLFALLLAEDSLKLLAYMVQSSDIPASSVDGCKFVLASNKDGHGNHVVI